MVYKILKNNELVNTIVADEVFVRKYCDNNGFRFESVEPSQEPEPEPEPTETEQLRADVDFLAAMAGVTL